MCLVWAWPEDTFLAGTLGLGAGLLPSAFKIASWVGEGRVSWLIRSPIGKPSSSLGGVFTSSLVGMSSLYFRAGFIFTYPSMESSGVRKLSVTIVDCGMTYKLLPGFVAAACTVEGCL